MKTVGILALQGDFAEHAAAIKSTNIRTAFIKSPSDLQKDIDGLIVPGGESTVVGLLAEKYDLTKPIQDLIISGLPILATCAGLILLAKRVHSQKQGGQPTIGGLNIVVDRNFNGSQVNSFETKITASTVADKPLDVMFIRPPRILRTGSNAEVLATYNFGKGDEPVLVQQGNIIGASFHTELSHDYSLHKYFINIVKWER